MTEAIGLLPPELEDRFDVEEVFKFSPKVGLRAKVFDLETGEFGFLRTRNPDTDERAFEFIDWEADILELLNHPRIPNLIRADTAAETPYLVTEWLGNDTTAAIDSEFQRRLTPNMAWLAAKICQSALEAVEEVHRKGVVHRDLNRRNILKTDRGVGYIVDFDRASYLDQAAADQTFGSDNRPHRLRLERPGMVAGTLAYMPPEQLAGYDVDDRADTYAIGVVLYSMLFNRQPYSADSSLEMGEQMIAGPPDYTVPEDRAIPGDLIDIVGKGIQFHPDDRYQTASDMADDLTALLG